MKEKLILLEETINNMLDRLVYAHDMAYTGTHINNRRKMLEYKKKSMNEFEAYMYLLLILQGIVEKIAVASTPMQQTAEYKQCKKLLDEETRV